MALVNRIRNLELSRGDTSRVEVVVLLDAAAGEAPSMVADVNSGGQRRVTIRCHYRVEDGNVILDDAPEGFAWPARGFKLVIGPDPVDLV